jgi:hypothetical protein
MFVYQLFLLGHLPPARRVYQEGESDEEASLRPHQAHGHARRGQGKEFPTFIISAVSCLIIGQPRFGTSFTFFKRDPLSSESLQAAFYTKKY